MKTFAITVASLAAAASLMSTSASAVASIFLNDTIAANVALGSAMDFDNSTLTDDAS